MIYRLELYDHKNRKQKHAFMWTEKKTKGVQHINLWIHPAFPFKMFLTVLQAAFRRGDTAKLFYWDGAYWHEAD